MHVAEEVGLDFFGFGEHQTGSIRVSSPTSLVIAAARSTRRIKLGTTASVLSTNEPIRVFQQLATAAAIAPGRVDVVAGRGSSAFDLATWETFAAERPHHGSEPLRLGYARVADPDAADAGWVPAWVVGWALEKLGWRNPLRGRSSAGAQA